MGIFEILYRLGPMGDAPKDFPGTFPLRVASRLTGLSPELLRAWERRYGIVEPVRTPGGTRRYSAEDVERLQLAKAAVDAGHRIGQLAGLSAEELRARATPAMPEERAELQPILAEFERMDAAAAGRLLSQRLLALGPVAFARQVALPLSREIGDRWAAQQLSVSVEHLATGVLRSMLGAALQPTAVSELGPRIVFATPSGESHEIGLQAAALTALGAGACPVYLGADLPVDDIAASTRSVGAPAVAMSLVAIAPSRAAKAVEELLDALPANVHLWLGGAAAQGACPADDDRVRVIEDLEAFESQVMLLCAEPRAPEAG